MKTTQMSKTIHFGSSRYVIAGKRSKDEIRLTKIEDLKEVVERWVFLMEFSAPIYTYLKGSARRKNAIFPKVPKNGVFYLF